MSGIDLKDPDLYERGVPWDEFARLRAENPIYWNDEDDGPGFWALMRHGDIVEVSRQPAVFSSAYEWGGHRIFNENEVGLTNAGETAIGVPLISRDPPEHTQYRKLVMPAVSPARIDGIEERIRARVQKLVDDIPLGEKIDLVPCLAAPLPLMTLAELLGVSPDLWPRLYDWTNAFVGEDDPDFRQSAEQMEQTVGEFFAFVEKLYRERNGTSSSDIVALLANAEINGETVPFSEYVANMILLLVGGNETTRNSLSHSIIAFAEHPDQWDMVRDDPAVLVGGTEEMVRHASPVMHMRRTATQDTEIAGQPIQRGDKVVMWYISANRDETVFDRADAFALRRPGRKQIGFGTGQHVCAGSRLAQMQLRVAFEILAERVKRFEIVGTPRRFRSNFINGLKNLDVILHPA